ncbi:hypothetical protein Cs7R123_20010 [Catellatospora sp. TT07R-123]|uniref:hypothetical protein n=1 Tax=Catellatospora sp. TT07R-123 TaxID=2733863 RepID=UPI001AFDDC7A|nr:hypothetical protein [Catellatospora sp. TT07R-123]GHJ44659.1 hypothetical protein Cs7R123_20010 [Catellatospora sp. TT07R-123]
MNRHIRAAALVTMALALAGATACTAEQAPPRPSGTAAQPSPSQAQTPSAAASPAAAPSPTVTLHQIELVAPPKIGSRAKSTDPKLTYAAQGVENVGKSVAPANSRVISAFYGSVPAKNLLFVAAVATPLSVTPGAQDAAELFDVAKGLGFTLPTELGIGPDKRWGGQAGCVKGSFQSRSGVVCVWFDRETYGVAFREGAASASGIEELRKARDLMVRRTAI